MPLGITLHLEIIRRNSRKMNGSRTFRCQEIDRVTADKNISVVWASCQISNIAGAHAPGMPGTFSSPPRVSDSDMHHGTCVTHVPWCMPGSLNSGFRWIRRRGGNFSGIPGACATRNFTYLIRGPFASKHQNIYNALWNDPWILQLYDLKRVPASLTHWSWEMRF